MRIYTKNIRKYAKILSLAYIKGDRKTESLLLNFKDKYIYFTNFNFSGRLKFDCEAISDNSYDNILVDIPIFMALVNQYEYLELNEKLEFSYNNEKFKIPLLVVDENNYSIPNFQHKDENWTKYNLYSKSIKNIEKAMGYSSLSDYEYEGVLLKDNTIISTDRSKFFIALSDFNYNNIKLSNTILKFITTGYYQIFIPFLDKENKHKLIKGENISTNIFLFTNGSTSCIVINDEFEVICPENLQLNIPDINELEFIEKYDHETYFIFEKQTMVGLLKFFEPFLKNTKNEKISLNIINESILNLKVEEPDINGIREINLKECSVELIGKSVLVPRYLLYQALMTIEDDFIKMQIDENASAFNVIGEDNKD